MPERLDRVAISTSRGTIEIPWSSRDALLEQIKLEDAGQTIRFAFIAVGASRPVELKLEDAALLVQAIGRWMRRAGGPSELPPGIYELRRALTDDLHDAGD
jgi:hypothetical protein